MNKYLPHAYIKNTKSIQDFIYKNIREIKGNQEKGKSRYCTRFRRPNSLKTFPSGVTNCHNLPFSGRVMRDSRVCLPREENAWSRHQRLFEENVRKKNQKVGLRTFRVEGSGVVFTHGEGISTPRVRHKGQHPLIKCAKSWLYFILFSFFTFFIFWGRQKRGFCSYVSSIAMRNLDLCSSLERKKVIWSVDFRLLNGSFSPIKVKRDR